MRQWTPCDPILLGTCQSQGPCPRWGTHPRDTEALGLGTRALFSARRKLSQPLPSGNSVGPGTITLGLRMGAQEPRDALTKLGESKGSNLDLSFSPLVILRKVALPFPASVSPSAHTLEQTRGQSVTCRRHFAIPSVGRGEEARTALASS